MPPEKINLLKAAERITEVFKPRVAGRVNDAEVKIAKFGEVFDWHAHAEEDEGFFVLEGAIALDFRDGSVDLAEGDFLVVPHGVEHRPRALTHEPVVLMFEPATTLNTGNAESKFTVTELERL